MPRQTGLRLTYAKHNEVRCFHCQCLILDEPSEAVNDGEFRVYWQYCFRCDIKTFYNLEVPSADHA